MQRLLLVTLLTLASSTIRSQARGPDPAATSLPAAPDPFESELRAQGWTREPDVAPCALRQPELSPSDAVRIAMTNPAALPAPELHCGSSRVALPIERSAELLRRVQDPPPAPPRVEWTVRATGRTSGAFAVLDVDLPPLRSPPPPAAVVSAPMRREGAVAIMPRPTLDPARIGVGSRFNRVPEPPPAPKRPALSARRAEPLREDALVATLDGTSWISLELADDETLRRFSLGPDEVFAGSGRLFVAPRVLETDAQLELLAVDAGLAVTSLGTPAPADAGRWVRVTDARERAGAIEALIVVDQLEGRSVRSTWGALVRRDPERGWQVLERMFAPAPRGEIARLAFDSDPARVRVLAGGARATRALASLASPVPSAP